MVYVRVCIAFTPDGGMDWVGRGANRFWYAYIFTCVSCGIGHLLLSASLDGKCKIWDAVEDRNVRRTYCGHSEAVR